MEIGTEISKKIRAAIKGKLQELGAYVDEELPDYIMVMVANKKNAQQMADDLSLFLGNNTIKFTIWLHGVLEKLRSVAVEPSVLKPQLACTDASAELLAGKGRPPCGGSANRRDEEPRGLAVSSSRADRTDSWVSTSSSQEHQVSSGRRSTERNVPRLMSTVKPLVEPLSEEAIIDIKPEPDDDLIDEDLRFAGDAASSAGLRKRPLVTLTYSSGRPTAEPSRPPPGSQQSASMSDSSSQPAGRADEGRPCSYRPAEALGPTETSLGLYSRLQDSSGQSIRSAKLHINRAPREEDMSWKRKAPVVSSIVRVSKTAEEDLDSDEQEEEEEENYGARSGGLSSSVSLPSKPERRPTLPPSKQANKNLILKAISEAQESVSKTTNYPTAAAPQRQMVPVAPRTRSASEDMGAAVQQVQESLRSAEFSLQTRAPMETVSERRPVQTRSLGSRLQPDTQEESLRRLQAGVSEMSAVKPNDTRSFILKRSQLEDVGSVRSRLGTLVPVEFKEVSTSVAQTRDASEPRHCPSPKFIVTLDGVPSPQGYMDEEDRDAEDTVLKENVKIIKSKLSARQLDRKPKMNVHQRLERELDYSDDEGETDVVPIKRQKVLERCKYWPVCKSGAECVYHHPTTLCKTFPSCKFGDKCLFVHPNCKYDAKCTKADCPYTHASRRGPALPVKPVPQSSGNICRFFPDCRKLDCQFYHPKPCRFTTQCKRPDCNFYHPSVSLPPRHALKWTKAQNS
ncbi:zinc finger CCCH domain-containing protein 14 isoform X1 [Lepisosteus oculatus]|uniref:zinc finger CCCH domain-containing protein 14 isoform X1 n=1 Tax=Lepisosteus oculatus TaxID=7918 RepID=UPI00073FC05D|nr:PREDICTED: zinc finger CCCH domain-containing protein 14 isoform X1 [Lepisosteus oculatus]